MYTQPTMFISHKLSSSEELTGTILTTLQKNVIQNHIAATLQLLFNLIPDPNNYSLFIQTESNYKGQIQAYQYLLDCSDAAEYVTAIPQSN